MSEEMTRVEAVEMVFSFAGAFAVSTPDFNLNDTLSSAEQVLVALGASNDEIDQGKLKLAVTLLGVMMERDIPVPGVTDDLP